MTTYRELTLNETIKFRNTKNRYDLYDFLSSVEDMVYRVENKNETTGEGFSKLYSSKLDKYELAEALNIEHIKVYRVKG